MKEIERLFNEERRVAMQEIVTKGKAAAAFAKRAINALYEDGRSCTCDCTDACEAAIKEANEIVEIAMSFKEAQNERK